MYNVYNIAGSLRRHGRSPRSPADSCISSGNGVDEYNDRGVDDRSSLSPSPDSLLSEDRRTPQHPSVSVYAPSSRMMPSYTTISAAGSSPPPPITHSVHSMTSMHQSSANIGPMSGGMTPVASGMGISHHSGLQFMKRGGYFIL